jgi:hypothetical protein
VYQILWVRVFRVHTISGRGFNLFKPLRRHFRATVTPKPGGARLFAEGRRWLSAYIAARQPKWRTVDRAAEYQILWVRGFRDHTISRRGFNLFKPLRHHFPATQLPSCCLAGVEFHELQ